MTQQTQRVRPLERVRGVVEGTEAGELAATDRDSEYEIIRRRLGGFDYATLGKECKGAGKGYLAKLRRLAWAELTCLVAQHRETGRIRDRRGDGRWCPFVRFLALPTDYRGGFPPE